MGDLKEDVISTATNAVKMSATRKGSQLDCSEASLAVVEAMIDEVTPFFEEMTPDQREMLAQDFGCYILEIGRREFGGRYEWFDQRDQPVLVVERAGFRIALMTWDKVRGRLTGD